MLVFSLPDYPALAAPVRRKEILAHQAFLYLIYEDLTMTGLFYNTSGVGPYLVDSNYGRTPLSWASGDGHMMVVQTLLQTDTTDADSKDILGRTPLSWAAGSGHEEAVQLLLDSSKVDADSKDVSGRTPLSWAAGSGHEEAIQLLLDSGKVDANSKDMSGQTPLLWAVKSRHEAVIKLLLKSKKVDAESKDISDRTPLSWAAGSGCEEVVKLLLNTSKVDADSKDTLGQTPILWAAEKGHEAVIKLLVNIGKVDPDFKDTSLGGASVSRLVESSKADTYWEVTMSGRTPLSRAAENGHEKVVNLLLNTGRVNPDFKDEYGRTPLLRAARRGRETIVKILLDTGRVDADSKDIVGRTPLWWAAENGYEKVVNLLLKTGRVDPNATDEYGRTPLLRAARIGREIVVKTLLDTGRVDADSKDILGRTPLWWAAESGYRAIVKLLLNTGNVDPDSEGDLFSIPLWWASEYGRNGTSKVDVDSGDTRLLRTPLSLAAEKGHEEIVKLLLDSGKVDVNRKDSASGQTHLSWAARNGHEVVIRLLLDSDKVDPDSKDKLGRTSLYLAARSGHLQVVKQLLDTGKVDLDWKDECGGTPLLGAARNGHSVIVKMLLDSGKVNIDIKDTVSGQTPLSWAARGGHEDVVNLLLASGKVDLNSMDENSMTPLLWALENGHEAVVELLRDTGKVVVDFKVEESLEIAYRFLARWIKACDDRHNGSCQPTPIQKRRHHQIPNWVIDTWNACIVPGRIISQYIALSYVWQNNETNDRLPKEERLLLKQSNLSDFQKPDYLNKTTVVHLPEVIKDAINLAQKLGERYLWVDCLCIVQDHGDTRAEVERMDEIYSGAYFTIIAAGSAGLFGMRRNTSKKRMEGSGFCGWPSAKQYIEHLYQNLFKSKWATRGWTFQEQILSKRAVIFFDGDMFWDCQRCVWDREEVIPGSNAETDGSYNVPYYDIARQMSSISWPDFGMYIELVCLYNSRDLTYPQDSLPAFSGILNSFARSFPFGFVSGLPQLFLDIALLWQPFSKAKRRNAKDGGAVAPPTYLPSWSWCGWQCPVDPFSLRTGLTYPDREDYQSRALTWQTQGLVQWSVLSEDMQQEQRLDGPVTLEQYKDLRTNQNVNLPEGWSRNTGNGPKSFGGSNSIYFTHTSDTTTHFKHPVPINDAASSAALNQIVWPFLSCQATQAFFRVGTILKPLNGMTKCAAFKVSVFELPQFTEGPAFKEICHVLCLQDTQGRSAGLLRHMDDSEVEPDKEIELIAISTGSVSCADRESAFEEKIDRVGSCSYGPTDIWFERVLPGSHVENERENDIFPRWRPPPLSYQDNTPQGRTSARGHRSLNAEREISDFVKDGAGGEDYYFYNVLWIERKGDIAYRRAAGRVPKDIWEENCSAPIKVVLG